MSDEFGRKEVERVTRMHKDMHVAVDNCGRTIQRFETMPAEKMSSQKSYIQYQFIDVFTVL